MDAISQSVWYIVTPPFAQGHVDGDCLSLNLASRSLESTTERSEKNCETWPFGRYSMVKSFTRTISLATAGVGANGTPSKPGSDLKLCPLGNHHAAAQSAETRIRRASEG